MNEAWRVAIRYLLLTVALLLSLVVGLYGWLLAAALAAANRLARPGETHYRIRLQLGDHTPDPPPPGEGELFTDVAPDDEAWIRQIVRSYRRALHG